MIDLRAKGKHKEGALASGASQELVRLCVHLQAACRDLPFSKYDGDPEKLVLRLISRYGWQTDALNRLEVSIKDYLSEALSYELDWDLAKYLPNPSPTPPITPDQSSSCSERNRPYTAITNGDVGYHDHSSASSPRASDSSLAAPGPFVVDIHTPNNMASRVPSHMAPQNEHAPLKQDGHTTSRVWSQTSQNYSLVGTVEGRTTTSWASRKMLDRYGIEFKASGSVAKVDYNGRKLSSTGTTDLSFIPSGVRSCIDGKFNVHEDNNVPELLVGGDVYLNVLRRRNSHSRFRVAIDWARGVYPPHPL
jgi:hypothetical protein